MAMDMESHRLTAARKKMCTPWRLTISGVVLILAVIALSIWSHWLHEKARVQNFYHDLEVEVLLQIQPKHLPIFALHLTGGGAVANNDWEYQDQLLAHQYIVPSDRVLMMGGNIGGACVAIDKALQGNGHQQACVEPNPDLHETLDLNRRSNNASWHVVQGVVGNSPLTLHACSGIGSGTCGETSSGRRPGTVEVPNIRLEALEEQMFGAGKHFTFLHADCEGCVCFFLKENPQIVNNLRGAILELDANDGCEKEVVYPLFRDAGFAMTIIEGWPEAGHAIFLR